MWLSVSWPPMLGLSLKMTSVFLLSVMEPGDQPQPSVAPGPVVRVTLANSAENDCVPPNGNTTRMHVLIRSLCGFSECLSSSGPESYADSLTCRCKSRVSAEGKRTDEQARLVLVLCSRLP